MTERHLALLQSTVFHGPHSSMIFAQAADRRFRDQQSLRQPDGCNVDFSLLAETGIGWDLVKRDLNPSLFIDTVALGLNACDPPLQALVWMGSQNDLGRLADLDLTGFALIDIGEHPDRLRIDQREHRLACAEG